MQEQGYSFEELRVGLLDKLKELGCSPVTITGYKYQCNSVFKWLKENGYEHYTREAGDIFLQDYRTKHGKNKYYISIRTTVHHLNDILQDRWDKVHSDKGKHFCLPDSFVEIVERYCHRNTDTGHAPGTVRNKRYAVSWFLDELFRMDCCTLEDVSPMLVSHACIKITDHNLWGEIRLFLRYLTEFEGVGSDFSTIVPHHVKPYIIPSVYSVDEIRSVEAAIDTDTVLGKRDYAMILLASRMGMRSGDIVKLRIEEVQDRDDLDIVQEKTEKTLHLPLVPTVKLAIDDYLSARPSVQSDSVFLNVYAPYDPVTTATFRAALSKYIRLAEIDPGKRKKGPHALRASLASAMVNDNVDYETVRKVLGHSSNNAIKHYARIDVENLRRYSLDPPLPTGMFHVFLYGEVERDVRI